MDKKRFQMGRRIDVVSDIYDSQNDKLLILSDVVDLLNELLEENKQLKYDNFMFKGVIETFQKVAISERKKLEKENEQLKNKLNKGL